MVLRDSLTRIFLSQWGKSIDETNVRHYSRIWWQSSRVNKQTAFRLSDAGFMFLDGELKLQSYEIPFTEQIELSPQTIIFLEKYLDCPYHLTSKCITVFSERKSFEIQLFSDDIRKFGLIKAMAERTKDLNGEE